MVAGLDTPSQDQSSVLKLMTTLSMSIEEFQTNETQDLEDNIFTLCCNNFRHAHTALFRKVIATVQGCRGNVLPFSVLFRGRRRSASETGKAWECKREKFLPLHVHITSCS